MSDYLERILATIPLSLWNVKDDPAMEAVKELQKALAERDDFIDELMGVVNILAAGDSGAMELVDDMKKKRDRLRAGKGAADD